MPSAFKIKHMLAYKATPFSFLMEPEVQKPFKGGFRAAEVPFSEPSTKRGGGGKLPCRAKRGYRAGHGAAEVTRGAAEPRSREARSPSESEAGKFFIYL